MPTQEKTRSLVEAAVLAALTVILLLPTIYLPLLGMLTLFVWPVPITILGVRHGFRLSLLAMITAGFIAGILTHPITAGTMVIWLGFLGLALGYCFHKRYGAFKCLAIGSMTVLASTLLLFLISLLVFGVNPFTQWQNIFTESSAGVLEFYRSIGVAESQLAEMEAIYGEMIERFRYLLPATLLMGSVFTAFLNFSVASMVMKKLKQPVADLPPFTLWRFPRNLVWGYVVGIAFLFGGIYYDVSLLLEIGENIQLIFSFIFGLAGLAVVQYLLQRYGVPKFFRAIAAFFILINPLFFQLAAFLGILDIFFDFRKLG
ncbi:MAG: YybS family protein [bacterium]